MENNSLRFNIVAKKYGLVNDGVVEGLGKDSLWWSEIQRFGDDLQIDQMTFLLVDREW